MSPVLRFFDQHSKLDEEADSTFQFVHKVFSPLIQCHQNLLLYLELAMVQDISRTKSTLVALWTQSVLYGMNSVLFTMCIYVLVLGRHRSKGARINKPLLVTAIIMYTLCTVHVVNDLGQTITAFISFPDEQGGAEEYYSQPGNWNTILGNAVLCTNNTVADALLVYRLYIVWNFHLKVVIGPIVLLLATTVCGYCAVWAFGRSELGQYITATNAVYTWGTALFTLSLLLNLLVTTLIGGRLWWYGKRMAETLGQTHSRKYSQAMVIIVESGAIYSLCLLIVLIVYATKTTASIIAYNALAQIMATNPFLIIVRVGLGLNAHDAAHRTTIRNTDTLFNSERGRSQRSDALSVHVHRVTQMKADEGHEDAEELDDISPVFKQKTSNHPESQGV